MDDLISRLLAAIEETERLARAVPGSGVWSAYIEGGDDGWAIETAPDGDPSCIVGDEAMTRHMVHNDPASVLRRCSADRKLIALYQRALTLRESEVPFNAHVDRGYREALADAVRLLVAGYGITDHQEG